MVHQSLYRRYRPARFGEVLGQPHVVAALRNAVAEDRVGHAYLFSGPRGTGKTSTARILAKALNCENLTDGEPCDTCGFCTSIAAGTSYELHELDAASNNKVDDIRDLISRVAIGTAGRTKVYVLDEVHMLTTGAENALLKTLEEPPGHVVFVLCTTEPHKVVETIRSRTQHLHFELLGADLLEGHVRSVAGDAGLEISDDDVSYVVAAGAGSARDTLSALDAVAAAGRAPARDDAVNDVLEALAASDTAGALVAADAAARTGLEPRVLGEALLGRLRSAFLASFDAPLDHLGAADRAAAGELAARLSRRTLTFAMELLGTALVGMREAPDPRVDLDLALVRLTDPDAGLTLHSLAGRVERLEQGGGGGPTPPSAAAPSSTGAGGAPPSRRRNPQGEPPAPGARGPAMVRETLARRSERSAGAGTGVPEASRSDVSERRPVEPSAAAEPRVPASAPEIAGVGVSGAGPSLSGRRGAGPAGAEPQAASATAQGSSSSVPGMSAAGLDSAAVARPRDRGGARASGAAGAGSAAPGAAVSGPDAGGVDPRATATAAGVVVAESPVGRALDESAGWTDAVVGDAAGQVVAAAPAGRVLGRDEGSADGLAVGSVGTALKTAAPPAEAPGRDEVVLAWVEEILPGLDKRTRALMSGGRFLSNNGTSLRLAFPTAGFLDRSARHRGTVEGAFGRWFGRPVKVAFVLDDGSGPDAAAAADGDRVQRSALSASLLGEIEPRGAAASTRADADEDRSGLDQVLRAFPGSRVIELDAS